MIFKKFLLNETTEQDLVRAIRQNPQDIHRWLIYADWLEERQDNKSELIRSFFTQQFDQTQHIWQKVYPSFRRLLAESFLVADLAIVWRRTLTITNQIIKLTQQKPQDNEVEEILNRISNLIGGHGLDAFYSLSPHLQTNHWGNAVAIFVDRENLTVLYDIPARQFVITNEHEWYINHFALYDIEPVD